MSLAEQWFEASTHVVPSDFVGWDRHRLADALKTGGLKGIALRDGQRSGEITHAVLSFTDDSRLFLSSTCVRFFTNKQELMAALEELGDAQ